MLLEFPPDLFEEGNTGFTLGIFPFAASSRAATLRACSAFVTKRLEVRRPDFPGPSAYESPDADIRSPDTNPQNKVFFILNRE
jgi:hypothetical protein